MNCSLQRMSLRADLKQPSRPVPFTFHCSNLQEILNVTAEKADLPQNSFSFSADTGRGYLSSYLIFLLLNLLRRA